MAIAPGEGITQAEATAATIAAQKQAAATAAAARSVSATTLKPGIQYVGSSLQYVDPSGAVLPVSSAPSATPTPVVPQVKTVSGTSYRGTGSSRVLVTTYSDGTTTESPAPDTGNPAGKTVVSVIANANGTRTIYYNDGTTAIDGVPNAPASTTPTGSENARTVLAQFLADSGMDKLAADVWAKWNSGTSSDQIIDWVRSTPEYAVRYPAMAALRTAGRSISEAQYVAKEQADIDLMTSYGIPTDVATNRTLLGKLIANNVNQVDLQKRLIAGQDSIMSKDKNVLKYAQDTFGLAPGDLMAFVLAPEIATPVIEQKAKAIQIGGAAFQASQKIAGEQAMQLAAAGVTGAQAQQGFGNIAQQTQLTQELPGDISGSVTNEELINAQFNMSPEALAKAKKVATTRANEYQAGGQYVSSQAGVTGLGSAPQV